MKKNNILVADNLDSQNKSGKRRSHVLLQTSITLAKRLRSKVDFLFVEDFNGLTSLDNANEIHEKHLSGLKTIKQANASISTHYKVGSPSQEILKFINKSSPELVVMGTRGEKGLRQLFVGSIANEILRNSKKPVMVIGPKALNSNFNFPKNLKVLMATDISKTSRNAEKYALQLASKLKAQVTIFYSEWEQIRRLQEAMISSGQPIITLSDPSYGMEEYSMKEMIKKKKAYEEKKLSCKYMINTNAKALDQLIIDEAQDYSIIIMGTQSRNKLVKAFLGSTARKVILNSPIPVIIVRS